MKARIQKRTDLKVNSDDENIFEDGEQPQGARNKKKKKTEKARAKGGLDFASLSKLTPKELMNRYAGMFQAASMFKERAETAEARIATSKKMAKTAAQAKMVAAQQAEEAEKAQAETAGKAQGAGDSVSPDKKPTSAFAMQTKAAYLTKENMQSEKGVVEWFNSAEQAEQMGGAQEGLPLFINADIKTFLSQLVNVQTKGNKKWETISREELKNLLVERAKSYKTGVSTLAAEAKSVLSKFVLAGSKNTQRDTDVTVQELNDLETKYNTTGELPAEAAMAELVKDAVLAIKDTNTKTIVMMDPETKQKMMPKNIRELGDRLLAHEYYKGKAEEISSFYVLKAQAGKSWQADGKSKEWTKTDNKSGKKKRKYGQDSQDQYPNKKGNFGESTCWCCGKTGHKRDECRLKGHSDVNTENKPWASSSIAKKWKDKGYDVRPNFTYGVNEARPVKKGKAECDLCMMIDTQDKDTVPVKVITTKDILTNIPAFIDNGATQDNYVSEQMAKRLIKGGAKVTKDEAMICSCFKETIKSTTRIEFSMCFRDESINKEEIIDLTARVVASIPYDIIIGRPTIKKHKLATKMLSQFESTEMCYECEAIPKIQEISMGIDEAPAADHSKDLSSGKPSPHGESSPHDQEAMPPAKSHRKPISPGTRIAKRDLLDEEPDDSQYFTDNEDAELFKDTNPNKLPTKIFGTEDFQAKVKRLLAEFADVYSRTLRKDPANVSPMVLELNPDSKWESNTSKAPPRTQSTKKNEEILRQIQEFEALGVIEKSNARHYSQVLLTPKPDGSWRFCVDFRFLNQQTKPEHWPLARIREILDRIGTKKPTVFGKMDLTKGFYQAPLSLASRVLTAFICFAGIWQWKRVPMGLKGAPSFFQQMIASIVLVGLVYVCCEAYIDDIIFAEATEEEFLKSLRKVLERFRKHNVVVNPDKCSFGNEELEIVGHLVNKDGVTFDKNKLKDITDFPKPKTQKDLKSFLGFANYFRDHIDNYAKLATPLNRCLTNYNRGNKLDWKEAEEEAYALLKAKINDLEMLFYYDEKLPVYLATDACDYGIGAHCYQIDRDGKIRHIRFISKQLDAIQLGWSTIQKECYAIVYALEKLHYLLSDVKFTLKTDHRNLIFMNKDKDEKVKRWKLKIQEYDFDIEHLPGVENVVADGFSRLCGTPEGVARGFSRLCGMKEKAEHLFLIEEYVALEEVFAFKKFKIPEHIRTHIAANHNSKVGHQGVDKTIAKVLKALKSQSEAKGEEERGVPYLREYVKMFIKKCPFCQKCREVLTPTHTEPFTNSTAWPMERWSVDCIGPLPETAKGHKYILVIIDNMSRWTELHALTEVMATEVADKLLQTIGRYGGPSQLLSDHGSEFMNEVIEELLKLVGVEHIQGLAYSKEENAIVERMNKEVGRYVRALAVEAKTNAFWESYLPFAQRIINGSVIKSIGYAPAQILFGNAIDLDRGFVIPLERIKDERTPISGEKVHKMMAAQKLIIEKAQEHLKDRDIKYVTSKPAGQQTEYAVGDPVLLQYPAGLGGARRPPNKLMTRLKGPYEVINAKGANYTLRSYANNKELTTNVHNIELYHHDEEQMSLHDVANLDLQLTDVEEVIEHRGVRDDKPKAQWFFCVRWKDTDFPIAGNKMDKRNWAPWKDILHNPALHEYLRRKGMHKHIPKENRVQADEAVLAAKRNNKKRKRTH